MSEHADSNAVRYELLDVVASGGMATVWRARDVVLDRIVALKRPHPAPSGSEVELRFAREARTAATVSHPHLVTIFDVGSDDRGPFIVMEYVDGPTLAGMDRGSIEPSRMGAEVARALAALHAAGVVHRDVTPANILASATGAKLTDFGIARADDSATLTQAGVVHATPGYAAPEVLRGVPSSPASDVYSLAAVLSEVVTGHRKAASGTRAMPSDLRWREVLEPALSPRPEDRPTAVAFATSLESLSGPGGSGTAGPGTTMPIVPVADPARTAVMTASMPAGAGGRDDDAHRTGWIVGAAALAAAIVLAVIVVNRDGGQDSVLSQVTAPATSTAVSAGATVVLPVPTPLPATTASPVQTEPVTTVTVAVTAASTDDPRDQLVLFVDGLSGDEISERDAQAIVERVDVAMRAATDGNLNEAAKQFRDVDKRLDRAIGTDDLRRDAAVLLDALRRSVGIDDEEDDD